MASKICPKCGLENDGGANFCRVCATRLGEPDAAYRAGAGPSSSKRETQVDPNLADRGGGRGWGQRPPRNVEPSDRDPRPAKGLTVVDQRTPLAQRGRKLVGFLVTYDLDRGHLGTYFPLYQGRAKLGAYVEGEGNIQIDRDKDGGVSEVHCLLLYRNGRLSVADQMSSCGTWVDVGTASREQYPDLYKEQGAAAVRTASFDGRELPVICIEDLKVGLRDGSYLKVGNTVFEVKLVGCAPVAAPETGEP